MKKSFIKIVLTCALLTSFTVVTVNLISAKLGFASPATLASTTLASDATAGSAPPPTSNHFSETTSSSAKMRQRLEQLFTWRVSDRLRLTPAEEQKFTLEFKKLSNERIELSKALDSLLEKIEKEKVNDKEAAKLMGLYQTNLRKSSDLQLREVQVMKKLFGNRRAVDYVLLKREMTQKFKDVLTQNGSLQAKASDASEVEVIQEK